MTSRFNPLFCALVLSVFTQTMRSQEPAKAAPRNVSQVAPGLVDVSRDRLALQVLLRSVMRQVVSAAEAMPADKYSFAPTEGEFKGVRTFGQQVKHLSATNHILAAAALGESLLWMQGMSLDPRRSAPRRRYSNI